MPDGELRSTREIEPKRCGKRPKRRSERPTFPGKRRRQAADPPSMVVNVRVMLHAILAALDKPENHQPPSMRGMEPVL